MIIGMWAIIALVIVGGISTYFFIPNDTKKDR